MTQDYTTVGALMTVDDALLSCLEAIDTIENHLTVKAVRFEEIDGDGPGDAWRWFIDVGATYSSGLAFDARAQIVASRQEWLRPARRMALEAAQRARGDSAAPSAPGLP